jgi:excinuclease UvrABC helicase subunit UvrB
MLTYADAYAKVLEEARAAVARGDRVLVMSATKRDAEDVAAWLCDNSIVARYLHSEQCWRMLTYADVC